MKIERHYLRKISLSEFAERHDLTMVVTERSDPSLPRFFASFKDVEVSNGGILIGTYGDGMTEEAAMADYAIEISNKTVVVFAYGGGERRKISVPPLEYLGEKTS